MLSISIRPIVAILALPRVGGRRYAPTCGVFLRTIPNWLRSDATRRGLHLYPPKMSIIFIVPEFKCTPSCSPMLDQATGSNRRKDSCGCTGTDHRFRSFNDTNLSRSYDLPDTSKAPTLMVLTRSTEGLSAPLASLLHAISVSTTYQTFVVEVELPAILPWVGTSYSLKGLSSPTILRTSAYPSKCQPNLRSGASRGS